MLGGDLRGVEFAGGELLEGLGPHAQVTNRHITPDVARHLGPPVIPGDQLKGFEPSSVTSYPCIMVLLNDLASEIVVLQDDYLPVEVDQPSLSMLLGRVGGSDCPSLEELLRSEGDRFLEVRVSGQCLPDISEEPRHQAGNDDPLGGLDVEHLWAQEGDIMFIGGGRERASG